MYSQCDNLTVKTSYRRLIDNLCCLVSKPRHTVSRILHATNYSLVAFWEIYDISLKENIEEEAAISIYRRSHQLINKLEEYPTHYLQHIRNRIKQIINSRFGFLPTNEGIDNLNISTEKTTSLTLGEAMDAAMKGAIVRRGNVVDGYTTIYFDGNTFLYDIADNTHAGTRISFDRDDNTMWEIVKPIVKAVRNLMTGMTRTVDPDGRICTSICGAQKGSYMIPLADLQQLIAGTRKDQFEFITELRGSKIIRE